MRRFRVILLGLFFIILAGYIISTSVTVDAKNKKEAEQGPAALDKEEVFENLEIFADALSIVEQDYVEAKSPKDLIYGSMKGMLSSLDPHSQFMDPDSYKEIKVETKGQFGGIGIVISIRDGLLTIISPIDDTPGFKAGLRAGDRVVKIDTESTKDIALQDAVKKLRGEPGSKVKLTILRESEKKVFDVEITRDIIKIKSIKEALIIEDGIGYIRLSEFQENTPQELEKHLVALKKQKMDALILDLRNNPGGLLSTAIAVSDKFLPGGLTIVATKGRNKELDQEFRSTGRRAHLDFPMIVLVNNGSASGSEIVAGAIKDHKRGLIVGTKTFGKGSVQTVIPLKDGSALRLTTSKYYTPNDISIHGEGITPDVIVEYEPAKPAPEDDLEQKKSEEVFEELEKEEKPVDEKEKSMQEKIEALRKDDIQLNRAIDILKGIKVYGTVDPKMDKSKK